MADRTTIFALNFKHYQFSLVLYAEGGIWGKRRLGPGRYALDLGSFSILSEYYR